MDQVDLATAYAILSAKQQGADEVTPDHLLLGCLRTLSRFGIATIGDWNLDLEALGVDWVQPSGGPRPKVAYSEEAVDLFDLAARIARSNNDGAVSVNHLLAAFSSVNDGLMGELKRTYAITNAGWRAAVARIGMDEAAPQPAASHAKVLRDYLTPEEAAEELGVHVQTMRAYIRGNRLPAFRLAGERAIRILRADLLKVLEPLKGEKS